MPGILQSCQLVPVKTVTTSRQQVNEQNNRTKRQ
jgi:hypothetical protein